MSCLSRSQHLAFCGVEKWDIVSENVKFLASAAAIRRKFPSDPQARVIRCKVGSPRCFLMLLFPESFECTLPASENTGPSKKSDQKLRTILMLLTNKTHNVPSTSQRSKSCCYFFFVFVAKLLFLFSMAANKTIISAAPKQFFSNFLDGMALSFRWRASSTEWHEKVYHYQDFECCVSFF